MILNFGRKGLTFGLTLLVSACAGHEVRTISYTPEVRDGHQEEGSVAIGRAKGGQRRPKTVEVPSAVKASVEAALGRPPISDGEQKGTFSPPEGTTSGRDDDVVARQLREAAMAELDPELREALWGEYRNYTGIGDDQ